MTRGARRNIATLVQSGNDDTPRQAVRTEIIGAADAGRRLDNVLAAVLRGAPRSLIYKLVRSGQVRVNGRRAKPDYRVLAGDQVRIPPVGAPAQRSGGPPPASRLAQLEAAIIHEDEQVLVVDKPSGLACHAGSGISYGVIEIARAMRPQVERLDLGHRLDRETSGCLVLTKNLATLQAFHAALRERESIKLYQALLAGHVPAGLQRIEASLANSRADQPERRATVSDAGRPASTVVEEREPYGPHTFVRLRLETGRMHQIRAHARHIGHPVAGDREYGDPAVNRALRKLGLRRLFLHASALRVDVPGLHLEVSAGLPPALQAVLARLDAG